MHHISLDRPGADDGHLDHEVVVIQGLQARQHRHLRARLDLEHAHGVAAADHRVHGRILGRHVREREPRAAELLDHDEGAADGGQHAEPEHVHLEEAERVEVVLVPLDDRAILHCRVLNRHQFLEQVARDDEAADVLREVPREAEQRAGERNHAREHRAFGIEPRLAHAPCVDVRPIPPLHGPGERAYLQGIEAECLRHVADGAPRPVTDHRRGQRRAVAPVLRVDVLDHFLAPLVLEVHVDVGRLVALARNEALEEQRHARRVHLGDAEAVAHGGVGRGTPALAEDAAAAREVDDVVHGEEVRLVTELRDQREFVLDERAGSRGRALRPAPSLALLRELPEPAGRRLAFGHDLARIFVAQLVEREIAAPRDVERRREQLGRIDLREARTRAQVPLAVRVQRIARAVHGGAEPGRSEHVLQRAAAARVHVHVARSHERQVEFVTQRLQRLEPPAVAARGEELDGDPEPAGEYGGEPFGLGGVGQVGGQPEGQEVGGSGWRIAGESG